MTSQLPQNPGHHPPHVVDTSVPSPARIYDYLIGGDYNFEADRKAAEAVLAVNPEMRDVAVENRRYLTRAVEYLVTECGIRQFLDLGSGLPTQNNVHEVAHRHDPEARVVYVDFEPMAVVMSRALLRSDGERVAYVEADVRDVDRVLGSPEVRELIDWEQPVGLLAVALLHFIPDSDDPAGMMGRYIERLAPGSHVVVASGSSDGLDPQVAARIDATFRNAPNPMYFRTVEQIRGFLSDLELVPPGVVHVVDWPEPGQAKPLPMSTIGGVARVR